MHAQDGCVHPLSLARIRYSPTAALAHALLYYISRRPDSAMLPAAVVFREVSGSRGESETSTAQPPEARRSVTAEMFSEF